MTDLKTEIPPYSGRPLVYLDQNILDAGVKGRLSGFLNNLKKAYQVVYSDETLSEIRRAGVNSPDYAQQFLDLLADLDAAHVKIHLNSDFSYTNNLFITKNRPHSVYEHFCSGEKIYDEVQASMMLLPFKIFGGGLGVSFDDIKQQELSVFSELTDESPRMA